MMSYCVLLHRRFCTWCTSPEVSRDTEGDAKYANGTRAKQSMLRYTGPCRKKDRNVAQLGSAPVLGTGGHRFKSYHSDISMVSVLLIMHMVCTWYLRQNGSRAKPEILLVQADKVLSLAVVVVVVEQTCVKDLHICIRKLCRYCFAQPLVLHVRVSKGDACFARTCITCNTRGCAKQYVHANQLSSALHLHMRIC